MVCILLNKDDAPGLWLSRLLQQAGRTDIKLISAEDLVYAPSFNCGFQNGKAFFSLRLSNGFLFSNDTVTVVINRISYLPLEHVQQFKTEDRQYVESELFATFTFLFSILPQQVFNETTGQGFCGKKRSALEWMALAKSAGFSTEEWLYENNRLQNLHPQVHGQMQSLVFFNKRCYGEDIYSPQAISAATALGKLSGEKILEIHFQQTDNVPFFVGASTKPAFLNASTELIQAINNLL